MDDYLHSTIIIISSQASIDYLFLLSLFCFILISVITDSKVNGIHNNMTAPSCQQIQKEDNFSFYYLIFLCHRVTKHSDVFYFSN